MLVIVSGGRTFPILSLMKAKIHSAMLKYGGDARVFAMPYDGSTASICQHAGMNMIRRMDEVDLKILDLLGIRGRRHSSKRAEAHVKIS